MDTQTLSIVPTNDFTPGMEGSVHIALDGENVVPYVDGELAAELVRRYNNFPALVEALEDVMADLKYQLEARHGTEKAYNYPSVAAARALLATLKA